jgi:rhamnose transport system ATP-binding protein
MTPLLWLTNVSKSFGGVRALWDVSFELLPGEVHALVGENGSGKSTLIKTITGAHRPDSGTLKINGRAVTENDPLRAKALGVAVIYQQPALFPDLTVAENIALVLEPPGAWKRVNWRQRRARAQELLAQLGARIDPTAEARSLTMPEQQLVEIAKAIGADAKVVIMDEPTASLSEREVENLFRIIADLKACGIGVVYVSHRLDELPRIADRVTALRDGCLVGTRPMKGTTRADLIGMMVGRELAAVFPKVPVPIGGAVLETRNLGCSASGVRGVSLAVRAGEILGLAGLVGAGRTELARTLFGLTPADEGEIRLHGNPVRIDSPAAAGALGIAYVPEDRRRHGVILDLSVAVNTTLAVLPRVSHGGFLNFRRERALAANLVQKLGVKTPSVDNPVGNLSGGNQQKVALARWLAVDPTVIILDEPTQGVDVGAKAEIHKLMSDLAARGLAVVMISSELPEVLGMSDRIAVMHGGTVTGTLERAEATQERVFELALGHPAGKAVPA